MTVFPNQIDTDTELPRVSDDLSDLSAEHINTLRDAIFAIEKELGTIPSGSLDSLAEFLSSILFFSDKTYVIFDSKSRLSMFDDLSFSKSLRVYWYFLHLFSRLSHLSLSKRACLSISSYTAFSYSLNFL